MLTYKSHTPSSHLAQNDRNLYSSWVCTPGLKHVVVTIAIYVFAQNQESVTHNFAIWKYTKFDQWIEVNKMHFRRLYS